MPYMDLHGFYVLVSRVTTFGGLRLLQNDREGREDLRRLQWSEHLHAWKNGYDGGKWCAAKVAAALKEIRDRNAADVEEERRAKKTNEGGIHRSQEAGNCSWKKTEGGCQEDGSDCREANCARTEKGAGPCCTRPTTQKDGPIGTDDNV